MNLDSLRTLLTDELNGLHDAEIQLVKALPQLAGAASSEDLRLALGRHLEQSQEHLRRLERVFVLLKEKPPRRACVAMKGILKEAEMFVHADGNPAVKDVGLISAVQRVEHYRMARYGCARSYAEMLEEEESADLLQHTLNDERATDEYLTDLAERLIHPKPAYA